MTLVCFWEPLALTCTMPAPVKVDRSCFLRLCSSIQLEIDPAKVKKELKPLISPAATRGRKELEKTRKKLMYNAESALEPVGNDDFTSPSTPLHFILHFNLCLCNNNYRYKCVLCSTCRHLILVKPLHEQKI